MAGEAAQEAFFGGGVVAQHHGVAQQVADLWPESGEIGSPFQGSGGDTMHLGSTPAHRAVAGDVAGEELWGFRKELFDPDDANLHRAVGFARCGAGRFKVDGGPAQVFQRGAVHGSMILVPALPGFQFGAEGLVITSEEFAFTVEFLAIDDGELVFESGGGVDDVGDDVVYGLHVGRAEVEGDEVGLHAGFQRADEGLVQGIGAATGGHVECHLCGAGGGIELLHFLQEAGHIHFAHHVLGVVAGGAVCSQGHGDAVALHGADGGDAAGELHVAGGVVYHGAASFCQQLHVFFIGMHHVEEGGIRLQQAEAFAVRNRALAKVLQAGLRFAVGFGQVHAEEGACFIGHGATLREQFGGGGVGRVRQNGLADAWVALPFLSLGAHEFEISFGIPAGE